MSMHTKDWIKLLGAAALTMTGAGLAGAGPLAALLGGSGGAAAGAGGAAAAGGASAAGMGLTPAAAELSAGAAGAGTGAATAGALGAASTPVGQMLIGQGIGAAGGAVAPKYDNTTVGQAPQAQTMDLNSLVQQPQQRQSNLPKLQLGFRRPY